MTFYISIVYVLGRVLRSIISGKGLEFVITDQPNPDNLINLCEGIYVARMARKLNEERVLYYELIDILRSPEIVKKITGQSSIKDKYKQE